jgi:hypothetical protein
VNHSSIDISSSSQIGVQFKHLHVLLSLLLNFGDALLQDLLAMYRTVSYCLFAQNLSILLLIFRKKFFFSSSIMLVNFTVHMLKILLVC